ncbi:MAG: hypothetical protein ACOVNR_10850 [Chitinophagaceae bacterium]
MKKKILNGLIIVSSLLGYLQWGGNNSLFLAEAEWQIFKNLFTHPTSVMHPFIIIPLIGQVLLFITLFLQQPKKLLTIIGVSSVGLLLFLMLFIGIIDTNFKILISVTPFWVLVIFRFTVFKNK